MNFVTMASHMTVFCIACGVMCCLLRCVAGAPQVTRPGQSIMSEDECMHSDQVLELCQKCATKSKSNIVYPMCCESKEEAREWCNSFLGYGIHDLMRYS